MLCYNKIISRIIMNTTQSTINPPKPPDDGSRHLAARMRHIQPSWTLRITAMADALARGQKV